MHQCGHLHALDQIAPFASNANAVVRAEVIKGFSDYYYSVGAHGYFTRQVCTAIEDLFVQDEMSTPNLLDQVACS